jgi:ATP-dependent helicase/nuclease subunit A
VVDDAREYVRSAVSRRNRLKSYLNMVYDAVSKDKVFIRDKESFASVKDDPHKAEVVHGIRFGFDVDESELPVTMAELRERLNFRYEPYPEELLKRKYSVSEVSELAAGLLRKRSGIRTSAAGASDAIARGNAYHKVMEHIPFTPDGKSAEDIAAFIARLREKNILSDKEASLVEPERIAEFFASELGKRAVASDDIRKESPFILRTKLGGRTVVVQGVIDCYFREGDSYVLVDYKSSYVDPRDPDAAKEMLLERYAVQLDLYREALETIGGIPVSSAYLYLFSSGDWVVR